MASEQVPSSVLTPPSQFAPLQAWLARLGLSGKILAGGSLVGLIAVFLPLLSMSIDMPTPGGANLFRGKAGANLPALSTSQSVMVVGDWRGVLCLVGYLAAAILAFVLYPPNGLVQKAIGWAGVGVGAFIALLALWLLVHALNGSAGLMGLVQINVGFGAILNLLAGAAVATGGFLKAREEKLI